MLFQFLWNTASNLKKLLLLLQRLFEIWVLIYKIMSFVPHVKNMTNTFFKTLGSNLRNLVAILLCKCSFQNRICGTYLFSLICNHINLWREFREDGVYSAIGVPNKIFISSFLKSRGTCLKIFLNINWSTICVIVHKSGKCYPFIFLRSTNTNIHQCSPLISVCIQFKAISNKIEILLVN